MAFGLLLAYLSLAAIVVDKRQFKFTARISPQPRPQSAGRFGHGLRLGLAGRGHMSHGAQQGPTIGDMAAILVALTALIPVLELANVKEAEECHLIPTSGA